MNWNQPLLRVGCGVVSPSALPYLTKKGSVCNIVEVRWDGFKKLGVSAQKILPTLRQRKMPVLLTPRIVSEGGVYSWKKGERVADTKELLPHVDAVDIELAHVEECAEILRLARKQKKKIILSVHSLKKNLTSKRLNSLLARFLEHRGAIYKIVGHADRREHLVCLTEFLLKNKNHPLAIMAVGKLASASRIILPALGSKLVYGYVHRPTAPGQPSIESVSDQLKKLGLI